MLNHIPEDPQAVTTQWLTEVLHDQKVILQGEIKSIQVNLMQELEGSLGQIARLNLSYRQPEDNAPTSLIGKFPAADLAMRKLVHDAGFYEREVRFYEMTRASDLPIPGCYYSAFDNETGSSILLLEDLGHLRVADIVAGASLTEAQSTVEALAILHAHWWDSPQLKAMSWLPSFERNVQLMRDVVDWETFFCQVESLLPNFNLSTSFLEVSQDLDHYLDELCNQLIAQPRTCIHCDTHLDNLLFGSLPNDPPIKIVDWQFAAQGRGVIDVAYFLIRSVPPDQRQQVEHQLLQTYHTRLIQNGVRNYDFDECWAEYQQAFFWPFLALAAAVSANAKSFTQKPDRLKVTLERLTAFIEHHTVKGLLSK